MPPERNSAWNVYILRLYLRQERPCRILVVLKPFLEIRRLVVRIRKLTTCSFRACFVS